MFEQPTETGAGTSNEARHDHPSRLQMTANNWVELEQEQTHVMLDSARHPEEHL